MKKVVTYLLIAPLLFLHYQCSSKENQRQISSEQTEAQLNAEIERQNRQTWEEALQLTFSDTDFLQTKQPMCDDAIAPYDYHTGLVGDKAYNRIVYIKALERAQKHLIAENNQLFLNLTSGADIHISEDLFQYIAELFTDWNQWIEEEKFTIIKNENGYYDIAPRNTNPE